MLPWQLLLAQPPGPLYLPTGELWHTPAMFGLALASRFGGSVLERGLSIASVAYGGLLGVFLLAVLSRTASERGAIAGMLCGLVVNVYLWQFTHVPFTWYVSLGCIATLLIGFGASRLMPDGRPAAQDRI